MLYDIIGYGQQVLGQVEAKDDIEAWSEAGKQFASVLDVRPALPERPAMPEYRPGEEPEEYKRELRKRQAQVARERKEWVKAMTEEQLRQYIYDTISGPAPKGSMSRMKLEGIVNWVEGWTAGLFDYGERQEC